MVKKKYVVVILSIIVTVSFGSGPLAQDVETLEYPKLNEVQVPRPERITLDNGMRLYLLEDRSRPVINVNLRINCGSYLEAPDKTGLASVCGEVMRTGGTEKWTGDEIDGMLEGIGASVEMYIGTVSGGGFVNVLSEYTDIGLEVLAEILRRPVFDQDKIKVVKMQRCSGIARRNDQIDQIARREFRKLIYGADSPYARHEEYATIDAISRADLVNFYQAYIQPENIQMAIWGDFSQKELVGKVKELFADWSSEGLPLPSPPTVDYRYRSKVYYIEKTDVEQAYIRMGHIGGLVTDSDYADRIVMNSILGGGFGSRITDAVRTKLGLAYSTGGSYTSNVAYPGYFNASASTKPQSAMLTAREMIKQVKSMHTDPPTEKEMRKGKDGYLNSFVFNFDSRREVLSRMMNYDFYGLPEDFLQREKEAIENVTPEAVRTAAKNNLHPDEMIVLIVGNATEFEEPLENLGLGPVDTIDITIPTGEEQETAEVSAEDIEKGRALLSKAVAVAGGIESFKQINGIHLKGTFSIVTSRNEFVLDFESAYEYPDKRLNITHLPTQDIIEVRDGDSGWTLGVTGEVLPMTEKEMEETLDDLARNVIFIFREFEDPYYTAVYGGPDVIDSIRIDWVKLIDDAGETICRLGIDADGRLVCNAYFGITPFGPGIIEEVYSNEAEIEGIRIPLEIKRIMSSREFGKSVLTEVLINPNFPDGTFDRPEE
jgi:zinc protease